MKRHVLILLILFLTTSSFQNQYDVSNFQTKVKNFINLHFTDFSESKERFQDGKNYFSLESEDSIAWREVITLKSKKAFQNHYDQKVYQRLYLGFFYFDSEEKTQRVFQNILNHFGFLGEPVTWGDKKKTLKTTPIIYIKTKQEIIACRIHCEHENDNWERIKEDLVNTFGGEGAKVVASGCGGLFDFKEL